MLEFSSKGSIQIQIITLETFVKPYHDCWNFRNQSSFFSVWKSWGSWDRCSASCCGGQQSRTRICMSCGQVSTACSGDGNERQICNNNECPGGNINPSFESDLLFRPSYMLQLAYFMIGSLLKYSIIELPKSSYVADFNIRHSRFESTGLITQNVTIFKLWHLPFCFKCLKALSAGFKRPKVAYCHSWSEMIAIIHLSQKRKNHLAKPLYSSKLQKSLCSLIALKL